MSCNVLVEKFQELFTSPKKKKIYTCLEEDWSCSYKVTERPEKLGDLKLKPFGIRLFIDHSMSN